MACMQVSSKMSSNFFNILARPELIVKIQIPTVQLGVCVFRGDGCGK